MTPEDLSAALAELQSSDWTAVRDAVEELGDALKADDLSDAQVAELGAKLVELTGHPKWEVRKAVARAVQHLQHETFFAAIAKLTDDTNSWVQSAAQQTLRRRTEVRRTDILKEQRGERLLGWLADLEARHGPRARDAALRVAEKYTDMIMRETYHEIIKAISPLEVALMTLKTAVGRPCIDREECVKQIDLADDRLQFLTAIIDSMRAFTREVIPEFRGESLETMLKDAASLAKDQMGPEYRTAIIRVAVGPGIIIDADRHRLLQAFGNLIRNALESYDGVDELRIVKIDGRADPDGGHVVVTVTDKGCGMGEEARRDAFQLFSSKKTSGTGIGLPLAMKIVESEHHGSITLTSAKGQGTTVTVRLPIEQDQRRQE